MIISHRLDLVTNTVCQMKHTLCDNGLFFFVDNNDCAAMNCLHGSHCIETNEGGFTSGIQTCLCHEGFTGEHCETGDIQLTTHKKLFGKTSYFL